MIKEFNYTTIIGTASHTVWSLNLDTEHRLPQGETLIAVLGGSKCYNVNRHVHIRNLSYSIPEEPATLVAGTNVSIHHRTRQETVA